MLFRPWCFTGTSCRRISCRRAQKKHSPYFTNQWENAQHRMYQSQLHLNYSHEKCRGAKGNTTMLYNFRFKLSKTPKKKMSMHPQRDADSTCSGRRAGHLTTLTTGNTWANIQLLLLKAPQQPKSLVQVGNRLRT